MPGSRPLTVLIAWAHFWEGTATAAHLMVNILVAIHNMLVLSQRHIPRSPFCSPPQTQDLPHPGHCKTLHNSIFHTKILPCTQSPALASVVLSFPTLHTPT